MYSNKWTYTFPCKYRIRGHWITFECFKTSARLSVLTIQNIWFDKTLVSFKILYSLIGGALVLPLGILHRTKYFKNLTDELYKSENTRTFWETTFIYKCCHGRVVLLLESDVSNKRLMFHSHNCDVKNSRWWVTQSDCVRWAPRIQYHGAPHYRRWFCKWQCPARRNLLTRLWLDRVILFRPPLDWY